MTSIQDRAVKPEYNKCVSVPFVMVGSFTAFRVFMYAKHTHTGSH